MGRERRDQRVAAEHELLPQRAQVTLPHRARHDLERGLLQEARDEEVVDDPGRLEPLACRPSGNQAGDPQAGRRRLRQRAEIQHVPVAVAGHERGRRRRVVEEVARVLVLDDEGAEPLGELVDALAAFGGEHRSVRVRAGRLQHDDAGARAAQRRLEVVDADAVGVDARPGRARGPPRGPTRARRRRSATRRGRDRRGAPRARKTIESADWPPGRDENVGGGDIGARPRARTRRAGPRARRAGASTTRTTCGPRALRRRREQSCRQERRLRKAAGQRDDALLAGWPGRGRARPRRRRGRRAGSTCQP